MSRKPIDVATTVHEVHLFKYNSSSIQTEDGASNGTIDGDPFGADVQSTHDISAPVRPTQHMFLTLEQTMLPASFRHTTVTPWPVGGRVGLIDCHSDYPFCCIQEALKTNARRRGLVSQVGRRPHRE
jgi:hypothetical protein